MTPCRLELRGMLKGVVGKFAQRGELYAIVSEPQRLADAAKSNGSSILKLSAIPIRRLQSNA